MSVRLLAVSFAALFLIGIFPLLSVESIGAASAGVTEGFLLSIENPYHVIGLLAIGLLCTWAGGEAVLLLPLSTLLMLVIGALMEVNEKSFPMLHHFLLGSIILFAMSVSLLRDKSLFLYIAPISVWAFFKAGSFMQHVPDITTPLFFMMGIIVSSILVLTIGVTIGITISDRLHAFLHKFKASHAFMSFLSLF